MVNSLKVSLNQKVKAEGWESGFWEKAFYYFQLDSGGCKSENCGQLFAFKMGQDGRANHLKSQRDKGGGKAFHPLQGVATQAIGVGKRQDSQSQVLSELTEQQTRYAAFPRTSYPPKNGKEKRGRGN